MSSLSAATASIHAALSSLQNDNSGMSESDRSAALDACDRLRAKLIGPIDVVFDITLVTYKTAAMRTAIGMGIFDAMAGTGVAMSADQLSDKTGADTQLIVRVMHMLVNLNMFTEISKQTYELLPLGAAFVTGSPLVDMISHLGSHMEASLKLPEFLASINYASPGDALAGPWQYAMQTDQHHFQWLESHPQLQAAFNSVMGAQKMIRTEQWFEYYPVSEKLNVESPDGVLLVDIGGGQGHDLIDFHVRHPNLPGKLILQDLPVVIKGVKEPLPLGIESQEYDFFNPQPVKGARAYYLRTVLHDWPDKQALEILKIIREAMGDESVLLVNEGCMAETGVSLFKAQVDFDMMTLFASLERTEEQWKALLKESGFKIVGTYKPKAFDPWASTLFEAVPV